MTMLDRYLYAVQADLPKNAAGDITAEIADDLQSQIEERESVLGRRLTDDEQAAILKAYGHPRVVAARYNAVQYLIGPELLPFYWSALIAVATIVVAIELIGGAVAALVTHNGLHFFGALSAAWNSLVWIFAIVTIIFAVSERVPQRRTRDWDPRRLPAPSSLAPMPRGSSIIEFIANFVALLVLVDASGPHRVPLDAILAEMLRELHASLTPAWQDAYIGTIAATALLAASAMAVFLQPRLRPMHESVRGLSSAIVIVGVALTLRNGPWITGNAGLNTAALYALVAAAVVLAIQIAASLRVLLRKAPPANAAAPG